MNAETIKLKAVQKRNELLVKELKKRLLGNPTTATDIINTCNEWINVKLQDEIQKHIKNNEELLKEECENLIKKLLEIIDECKS